MFIYGTQYYRPPYPSSENWREDLIKIKASNFNTVKLWAVWSWIERKQGEFFFDDLDALVDLCDELHLQIVINIIPEGMPYWASRPHQDARYRTSESQIVDMSGAANMPSGGSPGVCPDKEEALELMSQFVAGVVRHFSKQQAIIAFDVWNEPHMEPIWDYPEGLFCYCDYSKARFLEWLKTKYKNIPSLNRAWNRAYCDWEDVCPPVRFGTYPDMIDWRQFWIENLGRWLDRRVQAARTEANGKPIMTHVPFSGYIGGSGNGGLGFSLGDEFVLAKKVDKFGLTSFPKWLMQNDYVQHLVNIEMTASASGKTEFWQAELQSGAGKWEAFGRPVAKAEEIRLWNWDAAAGGARGVMYWQWRPEPSGTEAPGFGLTTIDGELSDRTREAAECARKFNQYCDFFQTRRVPAVNGIYVSRSSDLLLFAANKGESMYAKGLYGAFRACFDGGIPVRMVHANDFVQSIEEGLEALYVPTALALSKEDQQALKSFVQNGGTLIAEACPGLFDEKGILQTQWNFLKEVFGLSRQEVDAVETSTITFSSKAEANLAKQQFHGKFYRQTFQQIEPAVSLLATFEDGQPAVFENRFGRGRAILIGSFPSVAVALDQDNVAAEVVCKWLNKNGYPQVSDVRISEGVLFRLHHYQEKLFITAVNYSKTNQCLELSLNGSYEVTQDDPGNQNFSLKDRRLMINIRSMNGELIELIRQE